MTLKIKNLDDFDCFWIADWKKEAWIQFPIGFTFVTINYKNIGMVVKFKTNGKHYDLTHMSIDDMNTFIREEFKRIERKKKLNKV
jgi:hypothetical protein